MNNHIAGIRFLSPGSSVSLTARFPMEIIWCNTEDEASGYAQRQKDFDELIGTLDSEIRLITPTDPEGKWTEDMNSPIQPDR